MSNLTKHAEHELKMAGLFNKDSDYGGLLGESVMELINVFAKQGHSGYSASIVCDIFNTLAKYQTLTSLTGEDAEWNEVAEGLFQNKRNSAVFKDGKSGKACFIDAIIWRGKNNTWNGTASNISSKQYIKSFPFTPKTFTIDVIEEEVVKDNWVFHIKDMNDLQEVWKVYDENEITKENKK